MTNYHDVLTPTQAEEMGRFLRALTKGADLCRQAGVKPDISAAMWSWGNAPMTIGERVNAHRFMAREKKAKMQRKGQAKYGKAK